MTTLREEHPMPDDRPTGKRWPDDLPATPDEIDLERIVDDPDYRQAVKELLRRWGIGRRRPGG